MSFHFQYRSKWETWFWKGIVVQSGWPKRCNLFCFWSSQNQTKGEREKSVQTKVMDSFDAHENSDLEIKERWDVEREKTFKHSLINQRDGRRKKLVKMSRSSCIIICNNKLLWMEGTKIIDRHTDFFVKLLASSLNYIKWWPSLREKRG